MAALPPVADMNMSHDITIFPNGGMRILSASIHLFGSSALAFCIARRINAVRFSDLKSISWPRCCVVLVLVDSWLFVFGSGVLIHGVGMSSSIDACSAGIFLCIWLYAVSKLLIYCFLIEKVRAVWGASQPRLSSPVYIVCLFVMLPFFAFPAILIVGRIAYFRSDMACVIGLKAYSSISLLVYDLCINLFLNGMFLWPLLRYRLTNPRMRAVARRTLWAAGASLVTSIVNVAVLTILRSELGWVCLGSCGTDVTLNALVLFWVTSSAGQNIPAQDPELSSIVPTKPATELSGPPSATGSPAPGEHTRRASIGNATATSKSLETGHRDMPPEEAAASSSRPSSSQRGLQSQGRPQRLIQIWRRLFGPPTPRKKKEVRVQISIITTQHEIELGDIGEEPKSQRGDESAEQLQPPYEWCK